VRVLILGGTLFLGRHIVEALLVRGHEVTIFHRGQRGRDLFPHVERVLGDRATDLDRLPADATWDAVVDTSGYVPGIVAASAAALQDRVRQYVFISSISVYDISVPRIDEATAIPELPPGASREVMVPETYGPLKRLCELEALAAFGPDRTLIVRPGLIVGPYDTSDRFTYWPLRFARGGDVLVPDDPAAVIQWIDVRDLAEFIVHTIEQASGGVVNTVGPATAAYLPELFDACRWASGVDSRIVPVDVATLMAAGITGWVDLPVWSPLGQGHDGVTHTDPSRAIAMGLRYRSLAETVVDTLRWAQHERDDEPLKAGLSAEREAELLALPVR
jgi:2'-hydroxyisoflavone reductase